LALIFIGCTKAQTNQVPCSPEVQYEYKLLTWPEEKRLLQEPDKVMKELDDQGWEYVPTQKCSPRDKSTFRRVKK
jgi:hypothetical protein